MFDMFTLLALQDGWARLAADGAAFRALFAHMPIEEGLLDEWHGKLAPGGAPDAVSFRAAWAPGAEPPPVVVVQLLEEPLEKDCLAYSGGIVDGREQIEMALKETAVVTIYAQHQELLRALHVVVRSILVSAFKWFIEVGYESLDYAGGGDIQPERDLMPEDLGIYVRTQRWVAISKPVLGTFDVDPGKPWRVRAAPVGGGVTL
ncbi:MAG: hypothetical protein AMXMBFR64_45670 [Myxococcales bacterium]